MITLMLIQVSKLKQLYILAGWLAVTVTASFLMTNAISYAASLQPTYILNSNVQISAKGGFIDDPESNIPMFAEVSDGKWEFQNRDDDYQKTYYNESTREIYFKFNSSIKLYVTHTDFAAPQGIVAQNDDGSPDSCDIGIALNPGSTTGGSFVGVSRKTHKKTDVCTEAVQSQMQLGSNTVTFGNISQPVGESFLGITIETCTQHPGTNDYGLCAARRGNQLKDATNALHCTTTSEEGIATCNYYLSILSCLKQDVANTVAHCTARADATKILNGDLSVITADTTDDYIKSMCNALSGKDKRKECIKAATDRRDELRAEGGVVGDGTTCAVEGIGWLICPIAKFLGGITDALFGFLKTLLVVEARMFSTNNDSYRAWEAMRNLANVAFVIGFLVIIYSQITGGGLSNYGIKKLLPRIIIAAILVNVSYWLCAIAVDISNILGTSLQSLFDSATGGVTPGSAFSADNALTGWGEVTAWILAGGTTSLAVGGLTLAALGSGGFLAALALLLPILVTVLFAFITVVLVLAARQAIIIILIVISPLAFVAFLLPNTNQYFEKWRKLFFTMLILFPIISVIFGGSQLAAAVIRSSTTSATVYILSLAVQAVPLFITPLVLKFSGGVLNRIGGMVNNPNKGPFDRLRKGAEGVRDRSGNRAKNAAMNSDAGRNPFKRSFKRYLRRNARRDAEQAAQEAELKRGTTGYIAGLSEKDTDFRAKLAKGGGAGAGTRAYSNAINVQAQLEADEIKAASAVIEHVNLSTVQRAALAMGQVVTAANGSVVSGAGQEGVAFRLAAQQAVVASGDAEQINEVVDHMSTLSATDTNQAKELNNFAGALEKSSSKPSYIQPIDIENMKQNGLKDSKGVVISTGDSTSLLTKALADNVYSQAKMAQSGRQEMKIVLDHASSLPATDVGRQKLVQNAVDLLVDPRLSPSLGKQKSIVEAISTL